MEKRVYYNRQTAGSAGFFPVQIPRFLFSNDTPAYAKIARMSNDAKILYALFLDRLGTNDMSINFLEKPWHKDEKLAVKLHGGYDERGNAYVHYNLTEIMNHLTVEMEGAMEAMAELEEHTMIEIIMPNDPNDNAPMKIYPLTPAPNVTQ